MPIVDITEFARIARAPQGDVIPTGEFPAVTQQVAIGAGSVQSAVFADGTSFVRVHTDAVARIDIGANPTASATSPRMAAGATEYFGVKPGHRIAVITTT